jgi:ribonuclease T1
VTNPRPLLGLAVALVAAGALWWTQSGDGTSTTAHEPGAGSSQGVTTSGGTTATSGGDLDPASGLRWVDVGDLPPEAGDTLELIDAGGPFRHDEDGGTFGNFEGVLPDRERGYYREYTVETPGSSDRGARRIVTGDAGEYYWTEDHYQSFERIAR